jgi:ribosome maturation factor RimP
MSDEITDAVERHLEEIGFELVELERAGPKARPILRLRIDLPESEPGRGVSLEDCSRVSRSLEAVLEERADIPERYVLEVSSPGVERPLVRPRDFERFRGKEVAVHGKGALHGNAKKVEGELLGLEGEGSDERVLLKTSAGEEIAIPRSQTKRIHLVYRWGGEGRED